MRGMSVYFYRRARLTAVVVLRPSSIPFVRPTRHFHLIKLDSRGEREEESAGVDGESGGRGDSLSSLVIIQFPSTLVCCEIELGFDFVFFFAFHSIDSPST